MERILLWIRHIGRAVCAHSVPGAHDQRMGFPSGMAEETKQVTFEVDNNSPRNRQPARLPDIRTQGSFLSISCLPPIRKQARCHWNSNSELPLPVLVLRWGFAATECDSSHKRPHQVPAATGEAEASHALLEHESDSTSSAEGLAIAPGGAAVSLARVAAECGVAQQHRD